jgi:methionine sulfoxide reductase heme-binding subunit
MTTRSSAQRRPTPLWRPALQLGVHVASLTPFALLLWDAFRQDLTANPIQDITKRTGESALIWLVLSLCVTPLNTVLGQRWAVPLRRPLGLYAFFYALLHFLTFSVLDFGLDWSLIQEAIVEKRYVLAGFGAFLLMVPLALTSTQGWQRRLGKRWRLLHRAIYVAAPLAVVHFLWLVKGAGDRIEPLAYGAGIALLFALRVPAVRRLAYRLRHGSRTPQIASVPDT